MAKSKKLRMERQSGGGDFKLQTLARDSFRQHRSPLQSMSPVQSDSESSPQALPPRPRLTFGEFASTPRAVRVSTHPSNSSSASSCARKGNSKVVPQKDPMACSGGSRVSKPDGLASGSPPCVNLPIAQLVVNQDAPGSLPHSGLVHFPILTSTASCKFSASDLSPSDESLKYCLIGYIAGKNPGYTSLSQFMVHNWYHHANLVLHDSGWLIFEFLSETAMLSTLHMGPYSVFGRPLILQIMPEFFDFTPPDFNHVPIWVRFPNLPIRCWTPLCLSKLASVLGKPLRCDASTIRKTKLSFARVLIEVDMTSTLPDLINVQLLNGSILGQRVIYESRPRFCRSCDSLGHSASSCKNGSSKRKPSSSDSHTDPSSSSALPPVEHHYQPGSCSLGVPVVPQDKSTESSTFGRQSSPGRKRHKVIPINVMPPPILPGQTSHGLPALRHFPSCSSAPQDPQQINLQQKNSKEKLPT
ncbi:hypothetical protein NC651_033816 [Populus alba x Populus x berolinensis]|nr:hypothetical protein NC651_033816 [Populus alba x Populus x berolinensis]